ncbi:MAG: alkaline phosphatase [Cyclobacteriaceae bacterium]
MKHHLKYTVHFVILIFISLSCSGPDLNEEPVRPKNIILLIGDGMGLSQISSSYFQKETEPNFSRFNQIGLIKTSSSSHKITDSAAGATAFASGRKTYNGAIGMDADTTSIKTILELTKNRDLAAGVISTSSITHATPACFYAHVPSRSMNEEIARQLAGSSVDFFAGAGLKYFKDREDGADYYDSLISKNFVVDTLELVNPAEMCSDCRYAYLDTASAMPRMLDGRGDFLPNATSLGLEFLSKDEDGFFLMIEGSQIDWGGHSNDADYIYTEVLDFDKVIGLALDFAEKDGNTLVIVTADHETGGFTLASTPSEDGNWSDYDKITGSFSTGGHSSTLIPVFAYGPGSEFFNGIYENTEIYHKMVRARGF